MNERFTKGLKEIGKYVSPSELEQMVTADALATIAPDLRKMIIEFAYGEIYSRTGLEEKNRQLVVISSLVTQGVGPQIRTHLKRGLGIGLTATEIVEAILQLIPYVGFPKVQNALTLAKQVFEEENVTLIP